MIENREDLTDADALFRELLRQLKPIAESQEARLEAYAHGEAPQEANGLAMFVQKANDEPKTVMAELALHQYAVTQAFVALLVENNRLLLRLMGQGQPK